MRHAKRNSPNDGEMAGRENADLEHWDRMLDGALEETFPASDPVSLSPLGQRRT